MRVKLWVFGMGLSVASVMGLPVQAAPPSSPYQNWIEVSQSSDSLHPSERNLETYRLSQPTDPLQQTLQDWNRQTLNQPAGSEIPMPETVKEMVNLMSAMRIRVGMEGVSVGVFRSSW